MDSRSNQSASRHREGNRLHGHQEIRPLATLAAAVQSVLDRVSQTLTSRIRLLADRPAAPLPQIVDEVESLSAKVDGPLKKMGALARINRSRLNNLSHFATKRTKRW